MINITDKSKCCGCAACVQCCPKKCIAMCEDEEGFLYPSTNKNVCVDCGLCEKVCPIINQNQKRQPLKVYAAKNKNLEIRMQSSSGGIFTLLAENIINEGGIVFGARFDEEWDVIHDWTDKLEGIADFRGSKYAQSIIGNSYRVAQDFLKEGRKVLFSGTPCQIAGLKKYLRKEYDNLLTVDVVCHGVPSPLIWRKYLEETKRRIRKEGNVFGKPTDKLPVITDISFRDKTKGWKNYSFRLRYSVPETVKTNCETKDSFLQSFTENIFIQGFLANLYLRPSCYVCAARSGRSGSDITIADYWGVQDFHPKFDDDKGVNLILINSEKGFFNYNILLGIESIVTKYKYGVIFNPCIERSVVEPKTRRIFWNNFYETGSMCGTKELVTSTPPSILKRIWNKVLYIIKCI